MIKVVSFGKESTSELGEKWLRKNISSFHTNSVFTYFQLQKDPSQPIHLRTKTRTRPLECFIDSHSSSVLNILTASFYCTADIPQQVLFFVATTNHKVHVAELKDIGRIEAAEAFCELFLSVVSVVIVGFHHLGLRVGCDIKFSQFIL